MDYYFALLENYAELKRRKFKLSLLEQGDSGDPKASADNAITSAEGVSVSAAVEIKSPGGNVGYVWQAGGNKKKAPDGAIIFSSNKEKTFPVRVKDKNGTILDDGYQKLVSFFSGESDSKGGGGPSETDKKEQEKAMKEKERQEAITAATNLQNTLFGTDTSFFISSIRTTSSPDALKPSPFFPGYEPNRSVSRIKRDLRRIARGVRGEQGKLRLGSPKALEEDPTLEERLAASPNIDSKKATEAINLAGKALAVVKKIHSGEDISDSELAEISEHVEITSEGVMFKGLYLQYSFIGESNVANDVYRNAIEQINVHIRKRNDTKCPKDNPELYKKCEIKEIKRQKKPVTSGGELAFSERGTLVEQVSVLNGLVVILQKCKISGDTKACSEAEQAFKNHLEEMTKKGSPEEIRALFQRGLCAEADLCFVDIESAEATLVMDTVRKFLISKGRTEEEATLIMQRIASIEGKQQQLIAMALFVAATRGFDSYYLDIGIKKIEQYGGKGSGLKGQKDDIRVETDDKGIEELKRKIEQQRSPEDKLLAEAAKCAGKGVGIDNLGSSGRFGIEAKVVDSAGSRVKTGEGTFTRTTSTCETDKSGNPGGKNSEENNFLEENARRIDRCSGKRESKSLSDSESFKAACKYQQKLKEEYDRYARLLDGTDEEFEEAIRLYEKYGDPKTVKERVALARSYRRRRGTPSDQLNDQEKEKIKEEKKAFGKIQRDIQDAILIQALDRDTAPDGSVGGDSLLYLSYRFGLEGGSLEEGVKDMRMLRENEQHLGLMNELTYGTISMILSGQAIIRRNPKSKSISVVTASDYGEGEDLVKRGTPLLKGKIERGQFVAEVGVTGGKRDPKDSSESNPKDSSESIGKFDLFKSLIDNQNKILFELFNQTKI